MFILDKKDMRNFASIFTIENTLYAKLDIQLKADPARTPRTKILFYSNCVSHVDCQGTQSSLLASIFNCHSR